MRGVPVEFAPRNYQRVAPVAFPRYASRQCNMMPFVLGQPTSVPAEYADYLPMIAACPIAPEEVGRVGYLTVDERYVRRGTHRRGGLHTEGWGPRADWGGGAWGATADWGVGGWGGGKPVPPAQSEVWRRAPVTVDAAERLLVADWGGGNWGGLDGGLYVANSVPRSCALYDLSVHDTPVGGAVSPEQVADCAPHLMEAGVLYWLHDRVPHESLPVRDTRRQFFRLVTSRVSQWYAEHSTPNPLGVQPACRVIQGSKFA